MGGGNTKPRRAVDKAPKPGALCGNAEDSATIEGILEKLTADDATLRAKFDELCDFRHSSGEACMSKDALLGALADLGVKRSKEEIDGLMSRMDVNGDGLVDFDEFLLFVKGSSDVELVLQSVPILRALSNQLPAEDIASYVKLSDSEVDQAAKAFVPMLSALIKKNIQTLREAEKSGVCVLAEESTGNDKFAFPISGGSLDDFNGGITERLGAPRPNIAEGIKKEHTESADADIEFTTGNYGITTTPRIEYQLVTEATTTDWSDPRIKGRGAERVVRPLEWYGKFDEKTGVLTKRVDTTPEVVVKASLTLMEIIAIILYTGTHICEHKQHASTGQCDGMVSCSLTNQISCSQDPCTGSGTLHCVVKKPRLRINGMCGREYRNTKTSGQTRSTRCAVLSKRFSNLGMVRSPFL